MQGGWRGQGVTPGDLAFSFSLSLSMAGGGRGKVCDLICEGEGGFGTRDSRWRGNESLEGSDGSENPVRMAGSLV